MPRAVIRFYRPTQPCFIFSNFSLFFIYLKGKTWSTTEHYYQAQKFIGTKWEEEVRILKTPKEAARLGRNNSLPLRENWEEVKDNIMYEALHAKFTQHPELKAALPHTGSSVLIEDSPKDYYWGCGKDGSGKNKLGRLLVQLREELR